MSMNSFSVSFRGQKIGNVKIGQRGVASYKAFTSAIKMGLIVSPMARRGLTGAAEFLLKESAALSCETDYGFTVSK